MTTADSRRREKRRMDLVGTPAPKLATRIVVDKFSRRESGFHAAMDKTVTLRTRPADQQMVVLVLGPLARGEGVMMIFRLQSCPFPAPQSRL